MRWIPWSFCFCFFFVGGGGWGGGDESPRSGHSPRMRSGGSGVRALFLFIKTHFYGGALTSHFIEEHSSPTFTFPVFMMTSSNGNMFRVTGFCAWNSPVTAGIRRSSVNSPHTNQWRGALMFSSICVWTNGWVNNQQTPVIWDTSALIMTSL